MPGHLLGLDGQLTSGDLRAYDPKQHLGVFLLGELPLHLVDGLLFYSKKDERAFYDPSRNLCFPEALYGPTGKSFQAEIDTALVTQKARSWIPSSLIKTLKPNL